MDTLRIVRDYSLIFVYALLRHIKRAESNNNNMDCSIAFGFITPFECSMSKVDLYSTAEEIIPQKPDLLALCN